MWADSCLKNWIRNTELIKTFFVWRMIKRLWLQNLAKTDGKTILTFESIFVYILPRRSTEKSKLSSWETWQNYSLVEQPVDILIKKLTKLSIIDININSWSKYQIWQKYQIWPKFQKLTKMSTVDKNVKFDKNIKFDQNINLTKMSNLRCTFSKMYLPLPHHLIT